MPPMRHWARGWARRSMRSPLQAAMCWPTSRSPCRAGSASPNRPACRKTVTFSTGSADSCSSPPLGGEENESIGSATGEQPDEHEQRDGAEYRADEAGGFALPVEAERLAAI